MKTHWIIVIAVVMSTRGLGNPPSGYDDVAVVVNVNSSASQAIGAYFQSARSIPARNMIYIASDTAEEIDSVAFENLRGQIESHLMLNGLQDSINYIVTTKGVPLKVNRGETFSTTSPSSSVESELMLILGCHSEYIGKAGRITSPYFYQHASFSRAVYGVYLVTRLDAYTVQQVFDLIDRSGPGVRVNPSAKYVFDQDPDWNGSLPSLNNNMLSASASLQSRGKNVEFDSSTEFLTSRTDVIGYASWGSNDHHQHNYTVNAIPNYTWSPGSIAETYVSTSGRTFDFPAEYGQSLIADMIAEGLTGAKGYVYEPYSSSMAIVNILFNRYTSGYNLAESYFMATRYVSWMDVIVGDPKTTIDDSQSLPIQLSYLNAMPNTANAFVDIRWGTISETNNFGFYVQWRSSSQSDFMDLPGSFIPGHGTTLVPQHYSWQHTGVPWGTFYYRLRQVDYDGSQHFTEAVEVSMTGLSTAGETPTPGRFMLEQNFPNPFNPSTTIRYSTVSSERVVLTIHSEIGQHVATLVDEAQASGEHTATFSPQEHGLASGVYYYKLSAGNQSQVRKMVFVK
jgi:uncharacterized protein (TIGR03790 family)